MIDRRGRQMTSRRSGLGRAQVGEQLETFGNESDALSESTRTVVVVVVVFRDRDSRCSHQRGRLCSRTRVEEAIY